MQRRHLLGTGAALGALALNGRAPAVHAQERSITLLTWNLPHLKDHIQTWVVEFKRRTGAEVEWLDKKGTELPAFYQTQLVAGTPPDVIDIQAALWLDYAASGALMDLTPMLEAPGIKERFNPDYLASWSYEDRTYMVPFYVAKTLLFYNKTMMGEAGLEGPPRSFDELMSHAAAMKGDERTGFMTLNFDWLYWPLFAMNGVELLSPDLKEPRFNTPEAAALIERLAAATADGGINNTSWTGRWVEPNGAFAAGTIGMYQAHASALFAVRGQGKWVSPETLGGTHMPQELATPASHGLGVSRGTRQPELAMEFLQMVTEEDWAYRFGSFYRVLTGHEAADPRIIATFEKDDPLGAEVLRTQLEHTDKLVANWRTPLDAKIKEAFWPSLQAALLGQTEAAEALDEAERKVERVLRRG